MANTPRDISSKVGAANGTQTPADIARKLNEGIGKPYDISKTKTPLQESGTVLPPIRKGKK